MAQVFLPSSLRTRAGGRIAFDVDGGTVASIVEALEAAVPGLRGALIEGGELVPGLAISIDGVTTDGGLQDRVGPDGELHFIPALGGG